MNAIILAGGMGKRLRPLTDNKPKPMIEISGKPILEWQLLWLKSYDIKQIILCTGYMNENIREYFGNGEKLNMNIQYSIEKDPLGTGGALKNSESYIEPDSNFLVLNGDIMTNMTPPDLALAPSSSDPNLIGIISVVGLRSPFGEVEIDNGGYISKFAEKPLHDDYWINAGVYCFNHEIFSYFPSSGSLESDVFPVLATENKLMAIKQSNIKWRSIDSHKDIEEANNEFGNL